LSDETIARARRVIESKGLDFFRVTPEQFYSAIAEVDPEYIRRREKVLELGGLHIIGTERHEARRIDNQLRGRAGRQGEPGSSRFYLSLEDDLMRRFGGERVKGLMGRLGVEDNVPIEHGLVSKTIENAQTRIEGYNFDIRKHLLEYDDVLNRQRKFIYDQRYRILTRDDLRPDLREMLEKEIDERLAKVSPEADRERELWIFLDQVLPLLILPYTRWKKGVGRIWRPTLSFWSRRLTTSLIWPRSGGKPSISAICSSTYSALSPCLWR